VSAVPESRDGVSAVLTVSRGLKVLRAFRSDRAPVSNAELVRRTGLPKATVSRLTSTLLQLGFVRHVQGGREFELAPGALGMGHALVASSELVRAAEPCMQALADRLGVSVALAVGDDLDMLYVAYRASRCVSTLRLGRGSVLPMGTTSIGHAYLWGLAAQERSRLVARLKRAAGEHLPSTIRGMEASFSQLESTGVCAVQSGFQRDTIGVSVPVRIGRDRIVMGLSCGKAHVQPDLAAERKRIAPALVESAAQLERLLAGFDGQP
jgi:DNA-binding IclR family transcriptional regulator